MIVQIVCFYFGLYYNSTGAGHSRNIWQAAGRGLSQGGIATVQEKLAIIDNPCTSRGGGEERAPGGGAVVMR